MQLDDGHMGWLHGPLSTCDLRSVSISVTLQDAKALRAMLMT